MEDTDSPVDGTSSAVDDDSPAGRRRGSRLRTALVSIRDTAIAMAIPLVIVLPLRWVVRALGAPAPSPDVNRLAQLLASDVAWVVPIAVAAQSLGFLAAGIWFRRHRSDPTWEWRREHKPLSWPRMFGIGVGLGWLIVLLGAIVGTLSARALGLDYVEAPEILALAGARGTMLLLIFLEATLVGPIGEELFFRGHLFRRAESQCGLAYAQVLTATVFALGHLHPAGIPSYVVASLVMCWGYERWRTLAIPVIAHITMNTVGFSVMIVAHRAGVLPG